VAGFVRGTRESAAFADVRAIARDLPEVEQATMYGAPALKLNGRFLACMAINKAAEPETLVVAIGFDARDALIESAPEMYYLKDHYAEAPVVLVRLRRIHRDALQSLLREAWHFVRSTDKPANRSRRSASRSARTPARKRR
jgi:hypothetical protein